jgi:hypothetical protein
MHFKKQTTEGLDKRESRRMLVSLVAMLYIRCNSSMLMWDTVVVFDQSSFALLFVASSGVVGFSFTGPFFMGRMVPFHD